MDVLAPVVVLFTDSHSFIASGAPPAAEEAAARKHNIMPFSLFSFVWFPPCKLYRLQTNHTKIKMGIKY